MEPLINQDNNSAQPSQNLANPINPIVPQTQSANVGANIEPVEQQVNIAQSPIKKKLPIKLFVILGSIIILISGLVALVWLVLLNGNSGLERYKGERYSILMPKSFEKAESTALDYGATKFVDPASSDNKYKSYIKIAYGSYQETEYNNFCSSRSECISFYDKNYFNGNYDGFKEKNGAENIKIDKSDINGYATRSVSGDIFDEDEIVGRVRMIVYMTDSGMSTIEIIAAKTDAVLFNNIDNITGSFREI